MTRATLFVLLGGLGLTAALLLAPGAAVSGPFVPSSDAQVLEELQPGDAGAP